MTSKSSKDGVIHGFAFIKRPQLSLSYKTSDSNGQVLCSSCPRIFLKEQYRIARQHCQFINHNFRPSVSMGSQQSKPVQQPILVNEQLSKDASSAKVEEPSNASKMPLNHPKVSGGGGCPMKKNGGGYLGGLGLFGKKKEATTEANDAAPASKSACPVKAKTSSSSESSSGCPVKSKSSQVQYNVYSQPIDPKNNMPSVANQLPAPMQNEILSTERVLSTIPKGGTDGGTWTYPSPQMFYNSLARKNKLGDTEESDIDSVVAIHNNMNEKTWAKVMEWEQVLCPEGDKEGGSKLLKFLGRPSDLSPKARFKNMLFGHPLPFDRHDWTVARPDGTEVRYIIDYYVDETKASESENSGMPNMHDRDAIKSILVDVRPAADSVGNIFGRTVTMPYARRVEKSTPFEPMPIFPTSELKNQIGESEKVWENIQRSVQESIKTAEAKSMVLKPEDIPAEQRVEMNIDMSDEEARNIAKSFVTMLDQCQKARNLVENCKDEAECAKTSLGLTMCLAKVVCPVQQDAVAKALNADDFDPNDEKAAEVYNARFEKALENMSVCVTAKSQRAAVARQEHPNLFESPNKQ